ncbi:MAG: RDD family protein [bacterium]|nr:RDD family protein [bacterium]
MSDPAWESDPTTRHEYRWWDGEEWTEYVADNGVQSLDPLTGAENLRPPQGPSTPPAGVSGATANQANLSSGQPVQLASRTARFGGRLIDFAFFFLLTIALLLALHFTDIKPIPVGEEYNSDALEDYAESVDGLFWVPLLFSAIYEIGLTALKGQTLGKMATRTQVVRAEDLFQPEWGRAPAWGQSIIRWSLPAVLLIPAFYLSYIGEILYLLCYLALMWDRDRQGWHDKAARTLVVSKP